MDCIFTSFRYTSRRENGLSVTKLVTNEAVLSDASIGDGTKGRPRGSDPKAKEVPLLARYRKFRKEQFNSPFMCEFPLTT